MLGLDEAGRGPVVLLLPALSSISTRGEMHPLMERLASRFHTLTIDWPGFGTRSRPEVTWTPNALSSFLDHLLHDIVSGPHGVVAAGHAATYVLHHAAHRPGTIARAALIAPTWRGPLPTMGGGQRPLFQAIRRAVETPYVGPLLYRLNVNPFVVRKMVAGHVYSDANWLTGERLAQKCRVIDAAGARFASAAFVTGACCEPSRIFGAGRARRHPNHSDLWGRNARTLPSGNRGTRCASGYQGLATAAGQAIGPRRISRRRGKSGRAVPFAARIISQQYFRAMSF